MNLSFRYIIMGATKNFELHGRFTWGKVPLGEGFSKNDVKPCKFNKMWGTLRDLVPFVQPAKAPIETLIEQCYF